MSEHHHNFTDPVIIPKETLSDTVWQCFRHFYHADIANAAMHCAYVRFSPITFRLAEQIWHHFESYRTNLEVRDVIFAIGEYEEDAGR